jgi:hypothetical protein
LAARQKAAATATAFYEKAATSSQPSSHQQSPIIDEGSSTYSTPSPFPSAPASPSVTCGQSNTQKDTSPPPSDVCAPSHRAAGSSLSCPSKTVRRWALRIDHRNLSSDLSAFPPNSDSPLKNPFQRLTEVDHCCSAACHSVRSRLAPCHWVCPTDRSGVSVLPLISWRIGSESDLFRVRSINLVDRLPAASPCNPRICTVLAEFVSRARLSRQTELPVATASKHSSPKPNTRSNPVTAHQLLDGR